MPFRVVRYESTPNPNAIKCWLEPAITDRPRSFVNPAMGADDPIARLIFQRTGATTLLLNGDWLSINKPADAGWPAVKRSLESALAEIDS